MSKRKPKQVKGERRSAKLREQGTGFNKLAQAHARTSSNTLGPVEFARAMNRIEAGQHHQPINAVRWVERSSLYANNYNPNRVSAPELELLKTSILEDGWTQPIVARPDGEIVDGFHRWMVSEDEEVLALGDGKIPVVVLREVPMQHQMMSTIRHNRARGDHLVVRMADIVYNLIEAEGMTPEDVGSRLGMEEEEVLRLYDRTTMADFGKSILEYSKAWVPE